MQDNNHNGIPDRYEFGGTSGFDDDDDDFDDDWPRGRRRSRRGLDLSTAPSWVKACVWLGTLVALAGFGIASFEILGLMKSIAEPISGGTSPAFPSPASPFPEPPSFPDLRLGFGLFFGGAVLTVIGALGHSTSKRR